MEGVMGGRGDGCWVDGWLVSCWVDMWLVPSC